MAKPAVSWVVVAADGRRSSCFKAWSHRDSAYFTLKGRGWKSKVSLHPSEWRDVVTKESGMPGRDQPAEFAGEDLGNGYRLAVTLLVPERELAGSPIDHDVSRTLVIPAAPERQVSRFHVIMNSGPRDDELWHQNPSLLFRAPVQEVGEVLLIHEIGEITDDEVRYLIEPMALTRAEARQRQLLPQVPIGIAFSMTTDTGRRVIVDGSA